MPNSFPISRYLLIALAATVLVAAVPAADEWLHNWLRSRGAISGTERRVKFFDDMPIQVRPISPLH